MQELSVVIPSLGNHDLLSRVLDGYESQRVPDGSFDMVVAVDRADPDPSAVDELCRGRSYPVRSVRGGRPGASANRNAGWRVAEAPLVLFTDNDTIPVPTLISEHLDWHRRHPAEEVAVLGHVRWSTELRMTPFMRWLDHGIQFDYPSIEGMDAGWGRFYSANVSVKRRLIERVGGFDEERLPYLYEDLDFGYRADKLGLRLLYNRRAIVDHLRRVDLEVWRRRLPTLAAAEREFVRLHPDVPPYFHRLFSDAVRRPPARGAGTRLIRWVPRWIPWLGPRAWTSADLYYRQQLGPDFLSAWGGAGG